ncbi:hypothetical protein JQ557_30425 [Bradyrhizobium sp. U87765 SZCCT0131]|uniref:hypothetical protein n=1 Tax=unclassified Bradyrhizobium TaxID=2631580 RepID=UPI001BA669B7|nr:MULTISPECIES: hypothetical protein [unclassified Bradyrhizobium]MBR1222351.1 hypothetical protein [Bradyrhizobium sp. U87765 SZCCT0131]MBR1264165.1 hypothetical protein [Bradyrhizobium sp. U87765 SZCCT0134]MBR1308052.1 hypothetical protein [Bradyrhizobium sp. U87765 SZCCT0110]MBR1320415.1 hypothetical protein [Bradyrhizobium sp. U87765 SZCCT0109]MBR1348472.1 hypothetical protein [Bradyrhizobium sp. U87765 SZCCT0048]
MNARFRKKIACDPDGNKHSFSSLRHQVAQRALAGVIKSWAAVARNVARDTFARDRRLLFAGLCSGAAM